MAVVDKFDMMVSFNDSTRKTIKWYTKHFSIYLEVYVLNTFIMFREYQKKTNPYVKSHIMDFRLNLIRQLLENHFRMKNNGRNVPSLIAGGTQDPLCLQGCHFTKVLP